MWRRIESGACDKRQSVKAKAGPSTATFRPLPQARLLISRARLTVDPGALPSDLGGPDETASLGMTTEIEVARAIEKSRIEQVHRDIECVR